MKGLYWKRTIEKKYVNLKKDRSVNEYITLTQIQLPIATDNYNKSPVCMTFQ